MFAIIIIAANLLIAGVTAFFVARFVFKITFYSSKETQKELYYFSAGDEYEPLKDKMFSAIDSICAHECEIVSIISDDGLKLVGRYYHAADNAPVDLCMHGYRGNSLRDFCAYSDIAFSAGHNLLLVDQRAQGDSEGNAMTFGIRERTDCLRWIEYINERFGTDTPVILCGVSMGAATVLMAGAMNIPSNVKGIIADSPYSSPWDIIHKVCDDKDLNFRFIKPYTALSALLFAHIRLGATDTVSSASKINIPILIIHGEDDAFVPLSMTEEILNACHGNAQRYTFPGAPHCLGIFTDKERYRSIVTDLYDKALK